MFIRSNNVLLNTNKESYDIHKTLTMLAKRIKTLEKEVQELKQGKLNE